MDLARRLLGRRSLYSSRSKDGKDSVNVSSPDAKSSLDPEPQAAPSDGPTDKPAPDTGVGPQTDPQTSSQNDGEAPAAKKEDVRITLQQRIDQMRKERGMPPIPRPPDRSGEVEDGTVILLSGITRFVIRRPDGVVVKYGNPLNLGEVDAMRFAKEAGVPVPQVIGCGEQADGKNFKLGKRYMYIEMENVEGATLESVWNELSHETLLDIAHQLRDILETLRALPPPPDFIGDLGGDKFRDVRSMDVFVRPAVRSEDEFTAYLTDEEQIPASLKRAFRKHIGNHHRVVFSHCDLAPRNIMVRDNRIVALLDWEMAGWYPEYWEYVKFMHCGGLHSGLKAFVDEIFPQSYGDELLFYTGLQWFQNSMDPIRRVY